MGRLGRFVAVLAGLLTAAVAYLLLPGGMPTILRLIMAIALAFVVARTIFSFFRKRSLAAAHPEKLAILDSAQMTKFSWRATTFQFANDDFARQFSLLNQSRLMDSSVGDQ